MVLASRDLDHSLMPATSATVGYAWADFPFSPTANAPSSRWCIPSVFLLIAVRQMVAAYSAAGIWEPSTVSRGTWILCGVFAIVSGILLWLLVISRGWMEKIYFAFCTVSATSGLLRSAVGDRAFRAGLYIGLSSWSARSGGIADRSRALGIRQRQFLTVPLTPNYSS